MFMYVQHYIYMYKYRYKHIFYLSLEHFGIEELDFLEDGVHDDAAADRENLNELIEAYEIYNVEDGKEFFD